MATTKPSYTAITAPAFTLNSLANSAARISAGLDNTAGLFDDVLVSLTVKTAAGTLGSAPVVYLYVYDSADGTAYTDGATPGDAAYTLNSTNNLRLLAVVNVAAAATAYTSATASLACAFGGVVPQKYGFVVSNGTGLALNATGNSLQLSGVQYVTA